MNCFNCKYRDYRYTNSCTNKSIPDDYMFSDDDCAYANPLQSPYTYKDCVYFINQTGMCNDLTPCFLKEKMSTDCCKFKPHRIHI